MPISRIGIEMYRSIRDLDLKLGPVTVVVGPNGSGKSNLYRAMRLLHAGAAGRLAETFAEEGGMPSALYAGPKTRHEIREVRLAVEVDMDAFHFRLACGLPTPRETLFTLDPEVKEEDLGVHVAERKRAVPLVERRNHVLTTRADDGGRQIASTEIDRSESMLSQIGDPRQWPEMAMVRHLLLSWRFYHQFRCEPESPLRQSRIGVYSPILAHDGANLAAVLQTIRELEKDREPALDPAIEAAFPGCRMEIVSDSRGSLTVNWRQPGIYRPLDVRELSDGTLRYLCLIAALLTPKPPPLIVLNEPESSLHPDLLPALANLIVVASARTQILVTTHATLLADRISERTGINPLRLRFDRGQTTIVSERGLLRN